MKTSRLARLGVAITTLATVSLGLVAGPASAGPSTPPPGAAHAAPSWYVALGDSLAAGFQPGAGDDRTGGYVGAVLEALRGSHPATQLENLACSGETSTTLIAGGRCTGYANGSQLADALEFLRAHASRTRLVTLSIGANDVTPCLANPATVTTCVGTRIQVLSGNLARVLTEVHAASPGAQIVVSNQYNPFLASWLQPATRPLAALTTTLQGMLNDALASVTSSALPPGVGRTADVAGAFQSTDTALVAFPPLGQVPRNVAVICQLTWMCVGGDIHAKNAGYAVIATAVIAELRGSPQGVGAARQNATQ